MTFVFEEVLCSFVIGFGVGFILAMGITWLFMVGEGKKK
jgi:hypothetical protein